MIPLILVKDSERCNILTSKLYISLFQLNDLHLRASRRNTINAVTAFRAGCCCLITQSCKTIIQKYFDDRLSSGFSFCLGHSHHFKSGGGGTSSGIPVFFS